jgi:putative transferase (TIGR04331 family)
MFLITTAEQRFWKTDEPVLFLGEWCKLYSHRDLWENLDYEVLPYHWDDRKKLYRDYLYLDTLYEETLQQMTILLNRIHRVDHSVRYWRIIIGPWLSYFIAVLYDRYQSILTAIESKKVTNTLIYNHEPGEWLPHNFSEFGKWAENDDGYNHYLYDRIIEYTNKLSLSVLERDTIFANSAGIVKQKTLPNKITGFSRLIFQFSRFISNHWNKIIFVESSLNKWDLVRLCLLLGQFPHLYVRDELIPKPEIDFNLRKLFTHIPAGGEFEKLLIKMIIEQIPSIYIEGYDNMKSISLKAFPRHPKIIFTSTSFNTYDVFKFWAAHHVDLDVKLVGTQHGGHYGTGLWSSSEEHQLKIYDKFYTWGWEKDGYENTTPLSIAKFNQIKRRARPKRGGRLLMMLGSLPRYSYYMYSVYVASTGFLAYVDEQYRFVGALSEKNIKLLTIRFIMHNYGLCLKERWLDNFPGIKLCVGKKSLINRLNETKLVICTYNATTYLETFTANIPTVLFWNPKHWELRPSAKPFFDKLSKAGILHYTPESAAAKVNEISDDPISWWQQTEIQAAKDEFCFQFARTSNKWLREWKTELLKMSNMS